MSFGGAVASMITSLKNNRNLVRKHDRFSKDGYFRSGDKVTTFNFPEATPEQLNEIRDRMKRENRILFLKRLLLSTVILTGIIYGFLKLV